MAIRPNGAAIRAQYLLSTALAGLVLIPGVAAAQTAAPRVIFSTGVREGGAALRAGEAILGAVDVRGGVTQLRTADGDIVSMVGDSRFSADGDSVGIQEGRFTVIAGSDGIANVRVNGDMVVAVNGSNASASFAIDPVGLLTGRGLGGNVSVTAGGVTRSFDIGESFRAALGQAPAQTITAGAQAVSASVATAVQGFDVGQNPTLANVAQGSALALFQQGLAAADRTGGFDFLTVSDAFKAASLASVSSGDPLGFLDALTALARAQALIAGLQGGDSGAAALAYLNSLLAYFRTDGFAESITEAQTSAITGYTQAVAAGIPTDAASNARILADYVGGLQAGTTNRNGGFTTDQLATMMRYLRGIGVPAGLDATSQARLDALFAFTDLGGTFGKAPGPVLPDAGLTSSLTSGDYVGGLDTIEIGGGIARTFAPAAITFDATGAPTRFGTDFARNALVAVEGASGADWIIGRYARTTRSTDGSYFALATPYLTALPTSGTARYTLLKATTPNYIDGRVVTASSVDATLAFAFGTTIRYGFEGVISATDLGATRTYAFATDGGVAAPSVRVRTPSAGVISIGDSIIVRAGQSDVTDATINNVCGTGSSGCLLHPNLVLGGAKGQIVAGTYLISQTGNFPQLGGALVLAGPSLALPVPAPEPEPAPIPPPTPTPTPPVTSGTVTAADLTIGNYYGATAIMRGDDSNIGAGQQLSVGFDNQRVARGFGDTPQFIFSGEARDLRNSLVPGSEWRIGRLTNGVYTNGAFSRQFNANNALFYGLATQLPAAIPTSGMATFGLVAFTPPAYNIGSVVTDANLYGGIAIRFGATPSYAIEGALTLNENGVARRYDFASGGGLANPSAPLSIRNGVLAVDTNTTLTSTDPRCTSGACRFTTGLTLGGAAANLLTGVYGLVAQNGDRFLAGAVVYEGSAPVTTAPATPPPVTPTGLQSARSYSPVFAGTRNNATIVETSDHRLESLTSDGITYGRGTNNDVNNGGVTGIIGWTRWAGGTATGASPVTATQDGGSTIIWGTMPTSVPTTGTATYLKIGGSGAVRSDGSQGPAFAPGDVTAAQLVVAFDTLKVGMTAAVDIGGAVYNMETTGGLAAPSLTLRPADWGFQGNAAVSGGACGTAACSSRVSGFLAGPTGNHAGVAFTFQNAPNNGASINGTIGFASGD